jgi:CheY-like chemotaxis protein
LGNEVELGSFSHFCGLFSPKGVPMMQLLVVDDQSGVRSLFQELFREVGLLVTTVGSQREALTILKANCPHLLLLDYRLPDGDGISLLRQARRLHPRLIAILMTAFCDDEIPCADRLEPGVVAVLRKPFDIIEARKMVLELLGSCLAREA